MWVSVYDSGFKSQDEWLATIDHGWDAIFVSELATGPVSLLTTEAADG